MALITNMKIICAPNAFKESLEAPAVARAMSKGWRRVRPKDDVIEIPVADGGDGTAKAFAKATGAKLIRTEVSGPLGPSVIAQWAWNPERKLAVIEMAQAAGLWRVPIIERNPMKASTRGVGELINAAIRRGAKKIIIGLGGSATVDGGAGMAQALGWRLLDSRGRDIPPGGSGLLRLARIHPPKEMKRTNIEILGATDVTNPLLGRNGAAEIFGPQKGASRDEVGILEEGLERLAECIVRDLGVSLSRAKGAGAAGGMGAGLTAFLNARLVSGIETFLEHVEFEQRIKGARLVITGEGRMDRQTAFGKAPAGVAKFATAQGIPVVALAGALGEGWETLVERNFTAVFSVVSGPMALDDACKKAPRLIAAQCESLARIFNLFY